MHLYPLLLGDGCIPDDCNKSDEESAEREEGYCKSEAVGYGIEEEWRPIACTGFLFLAPCCGLAAFGLIYSAVNVEKLSFLNVIKIGVVFALVASAGIVVHVAFNLLHFGRAYRGPLL